jgi:molybdopterin synthase catalytic subunit
VAVNKEFAFADTLLQPGDEVALFPPVSGGSGEYPTYFALAREPLDLNAIVAHLTRPDVGAVVVFHGSVRGETDREGLPAETLHLEYEAYEEMARQKMAQIAEEIWSRWPLVRGIAIVQRLGELVIGETTTLVACAAGHRDQGAFDAARYGIDRLKEIVPIWKKEVGADRSVWVEGDYRPTADDVAAPK